MASTATISFIVLELRLDYPYLSRIWRCAYDCTCEMLYFSISQSLLENSLPISVTLFQENRRQSNTDKDLLVSQTYFSSVNCLSVIHTSHLRTLRSGHPNYITASTIFYLLER